MAPNLILRLQNTQGFGVRPVSYTHLDVYKRQFQDPVTLTVHYQTATGIEGVFEMNVGTQNMGGTGRYVRFGDEPAIYLMELELLDPMMRLAYQGMEEAS